MAGAAGPFWAVSFEGVARADWPVAVLGLALATVFVWAVTRTRIYFDNERIERRTWLAPRAMRWSDITALRVLPGGVILWAGKTRLAIWNQLLEGYPDLAAVLLSRVPPGVLDASSGRALLERQAAFRNRR